MTDSPLTVWRERDGQLLRLRLARPKANIIDAEMIEALRVAFEANLPDPSLKGVVLDADGPHFSFGASVEEHLPDQCAEMIRGFHRLLVLMLESPAPILVAIRGQCLGGGLELACAGNLLFAAPDAALGQPEIKLAVIAPAASCLLPERIGQARAEDLVMSGRSIDGNEAYRIGLVAEVAEDPETAALAYFDQHLAPLSASSLRYQAQAVRGAMVERIKARFPAVEALYLDGLMATEDAVEGLTAFIEKRPARWVNR